MNSKSSINLDERDRFEMLYRRQAALARIELALTQQYDLSETLKRIVEITANLMPPSGGASIVLWDHEIGEFLVSASTVPEQQPLLAARRVRREGGATRWIIENRQPIVVRDIRSDPFTANQLLSEFSLNAYAGFPLIAEEEVMGVLYALDTEVRDYTDDDLAFLQSLANRAALTISQVRLYESVKIANLKLQKESAVKEELILELQATIAKLKTMRSLLDICTRCNKIRDHDGVWRELGEYLAERSERRVSSTICDSCDACRHRHT